MQPLPPEYEAARVEAESRAFWTTRGLPKSDGLLGPGSGPRVHQVLGAVVPAEGTDPFLQRAIWADAEARYLALAGRRSRSLLIGRGPLNDPGLTAATSAARALALWTGGGTIQSAATALPPHGIQTRVERLATAGLLEARELPMRACATCRVPRPPASIVYSEEEGPAYLVRFALRDPSRPASLLVWTDALWKLLGTTAVLVHPDRPYVRARFRRRGPEEQIVLAKAALDRLRRWREGGELEVLEEVPGAALAGLEYAHPLATEFPSVASLPAPAGRVNAAKEVDDSGSGIVGLVPEHGAMDARVAAALGLHGWPVLGTDGHLTRVLPHKYGGLPADVGEAFILRDLGDAHLLFATLRARRGVPRCAFCGSIMHWQTARAWCLVPARLPAVRRDLARRLVPGLEIPAVDDPVPWPVSAWGHAPEPGQPELLECSACGRLAPPTESGPCTCGGERVRTRRTLLPAFFEALTGWGVHEPVVAGEPVRFYAAERRRGPVLLHHLTALEAGSGSPGDLRFFALPSVRWDAAAAEGIGADARRVATLRTAAASRSPTAILGRAREEERRLRKLWQIARELLDRMLADRYGYDDVAIGAHIGELAEEDRAFLSKFERMRIEAQRRWDVGALDDAVELLARFLDAELRDGYLPMVRPRLDAEGLPPGKAAAYRLLTHVLTTWAELYAPAAPHACEAILRGFRGDPDSVFERRFVPIQELALAAESEKAYDRWRSFALALRRYRRELGIPVDQLLPSVVLYVTDEAVATELRAAQATLRRLGRVESVEVASPNQPWEGKQVTAHPILPEIQRSYSANAGRIVRILGGLPGRRVQDGILSGSLEVALDGRPIPILRTMVEFTESLPPGVVAIPWSLGELFVQLPASLLRGDQRHAPALTPDGFRVLRALQRRIERSGSPSAIDHAVVAVDGPLAAELNKHLAALSQYFGGLALEVQPEPTGFVAAETSTGRSRRGQRWSLWVPGVAVPRRPLKRSGGGTRTPRVVPSPGAGAPDDGLGALDPDALAREEAIRASLEALDAALGRPVVGPAKLAAAWDAGYRSFDELSHAAYDQLEPIPGFGPFVAAEIVHRFGGVVPPRARPPRVEVTPPPATPDAIRAAAPPPSEALTAFLPPEVELPPPPPAAPPPPSPTPSPAPASAPMPPPSVPNPYPLETSPTLLRDPPRSPAPELAPTPAAIPVPVGSVPPAPVSAPSPPPPPSPVVATGPPPGIEIWPGPTADPPWAAFLEATATGHKGLCVSREFPDRLRAYLGTRDVDVLWLSNIGRSGTVRPGDLPALRELFRVALSEKGVAALYLDGVEYLVRLHTLEKTLEFLHQLDADARERDARVWVPVNPSLLDPSSADRLRAEFPSHADG